MKNFSFALLICTATFFHFASAQSWSINGNSGTNPPGNFLGTTDNKALVFKTNNSESMRISSGGKVGIGVTSPSYKLDVAGDINMSAGNFLRIGGTRVFKDNLSAGNLLIGENTSASSAGTSNTTVGILSLGSVSTGYDNTALGCNALHATTSGIANTALGFQSLISNTSGSENIAIGDNALFNNTIGVDNVSIGAAALYALASGSSNTAIGSLSLQSITSGSFNTALGASSDVNAGTYSSSIAIGYASEITANNQARIGNVSTTSIGGYADWTNLSDGRFKKDIHKNVPGLEFINKLQPITYILAVRDLDNYLRKDMKESVMPAGQLAIYEKAMRDKEQIVYSGFIAQDVEKAAKEVGYDFSGVDAPKNDHDVYGLRYAEFVVPLVKAVQELDQSHKSEMEELKNENEKLKIRNEELDKRVSALELQSSIGNRHSPITDEYTKPQTRVTLSPDKIGINPVEVPDIQSQTILGQNIPNPFDNSTLIPFRIPRDCSDASIMITNTSTSEVISVIPISCNEDHVSIDAGALGSGTYSYTLYVDGKMIDTRQMELTK